MLLWLATNFATCIAYDYSANSQSRDYHIRFNCTEIVLTCETFARVSLAAKDWIHCRADHLEIEMIIETVFMLNTKDASL